MAGARHQEKIQKIIQSNDNEKKSLKETISLLREEIESFDNRIQEAVQQEKGLHIDEIRQLRETLLQTRESIEKKKFELEEKIQKAESSQQKENLVT